MSEVAYVLDASSVIALLRDEPGAVQVRSAWPSAVIGAVNFSEVIAKLQERGATDATIDGIVMDMDVTIMPFDRNLAADAGRLRNVTRHAGLSLGDRACLALGIQLGATVLTADKAWAALDVGVEIELIR